MKNFFFFLLLISSFTLSAQAPTGDEVRLLPIEMSWITNHPKAILTRKHILHNEVIFRMTTPSNINTDYMMSVASLLFNPNDGTPPFAVPYNGDFSYTFAPNGSTDVIPLVPVFQFVDNSNGQVFPQWDTPITILQKATTAYNNAGFSMPNEIWEISTSATFQPPIANAFPQGNPFNGNQVGGATAYVKFASAHNGKLRQPLIFVDGIDFDPTVYTYNGQIIRHGSTGWDIFMLGNDASTPNALDDQPSEYKEYPTSFNTFLSEGYDIVFLDFNNGTDWIQKNGLVLVELLRRVNLRKAADADANNLPCENAIIGASMGGQVVKWALSYMELQGIPHETHTYLSFDSPQKGANIPLAIQSLAFHTFVSGQDDDNYWPRLNAPAARQMLLETLQKADQENNISIQLFDMDLCANGFPGTSLSPNYGFTQSSEIRQSFVAEMAVKGYPQDARNIAISCGSHLGTPLNFKKDETFFKANFFQNPPNAACSLTGDVASIEMAPLEGNLMTIPTFLSFSGGVGSWGCCSISPLPGNDLSIYLGAIPIDYEPWFFGPQDPPRRAIWMNTIQTFIEPPPYDNAPGCTRTDLLGLQKQFQEQGFAVPINSGQTCFMPTLSLLDINWPMNEANLIEPFDPTDPIWVEQHTPFSAIFAPSENLRHIELTTAMTAWTLTELENGKNAVDNASLILTANQHFNYGNHKTRIPNTQIQGSATLSINVTGSTNYMTPSDPPADKPHFEVYIGAGCSGGKSINIENNGLLQIGDPSSTKTAIVHAKIGSEVPVQSGGTLRISKESSLHIYAGATLTLDQNAKIQLDNPESKIRIEGRLLINGDMSFSGLGYFEFAAGGFIDFGPNATTFRMTGAGRDQRFIQIEEFVTLSIPNDRHIELQAGAIEFLNGSILQLGTGSDGIFTRNLFYSFSGGVGLEAFAGMRDLRINSCIFRGLDAPINLFGGSGQTYLFETDFQKYTFGPQFEGRFYLDLVQTRIHGDPGVSLYGLRSHNNFVTRLRDCEIRDHRSGLNLTQVSTNTLLSAGAFEGITIEGGWILWMQGGQIVKNDFGIGNRGGYGLNVPTNIFLQNDAKIIDCHAGIAMKGNETVGLVVMDCARLLNNYYGIFGEDIRLEIDPPTLNDNWSINPRANTFVRKNFGNLTAGSKFIHICYRAFRTPPNPTLGASNFWGTCQTFNWQGSAQFIPNPTSPQKVYLCLAPAVAQFCNCETPNIGFSYLQVVGQYPFECSDDGFQCQDPTGQSCAVDCDLNLPNVPNSSLMTVKNTFNTGLQQLNATNFTGSKQSFVNVATRNGPNVPTYTSSCQSLINASVSLSWTGLQPLQGGSGSDRNVEKTRPVRGKITLAPNPTDGRFEVFWGRDEVSTIRVYDLFGKLVFEKTGKESLSINAENWPTGLFTVIAIDEKGYIFGQQKLVVQR